MNIQEIHIHDSVILRVIEDTENDVLLFEVDYPEDWDSNIFVKKVLKFTDVLNYQVCEGPFLGSPTMLSYSAQSEASGRTALKIETTAGYRELSYTEVELCSAT